ncbi:MAG: FkbM family methyltransferase [Firmicutes bacterium]|nr:FkbM family methyltransferase [Bacillota bacterium]
MENFFRFYYAGKEVCFDLTKEDHISQIIRKTSNFYEIGMLEDIKSRIGAGSTVVDVGAFIGNHSVFFGLVCEASVFSFEPFSESFAQLKRNIELNKLQENTRLFNCALGAKHQKGKVKLPDEGNLGMARVVEDVNGEVDICTLDEIVFDLADEIDVIKIDVEGMELEVLKGAERILERDHPLLYIEIIDNQQLAEVKTFLSRFGYNMQGIFNDTPTYLFDASNNKKSIGIWAGDGNNFQFVEPVARSLKKEYKVKRFIFNGDVARLRAQLDDCDIAWFEWGNGPIIAASHLVDINTPIICRIHRYEAYDDETLNLINWANIDKIIVVAGYIKEMLVSKVNSIAGKIEVIPNGIDIGKLTFTDRKKGFEIAFLGRLHWHKDPLFALQCFYSLYQRDNRYRIHFAGRFCDRVIEQKFYYLIKELGIEDCVFYDGETKNVDAWLDDKSFIICSSVIESQNMAVMEAMTKGIKPLVYNFFGAKDIYPQKYIFNSPAEFADEVLQGDYNPAEYRAFVEENFSFADQMAKIKNLIANTAAISKNSNHAVVFLPKALGIEPVSKEDLSDWDILIAEDRFADEERNRFFKHLKHSSADIVRVPVIYPLIENHEIARWEIAAKRKSPRQGLVENCYCKVGPGSEVELPYEAAYLLFNEKRFEEALKSFVAAYQSESNPQEKAVYLRWIVLCLIELERDDQATNVLEDALQIYEDNADIYYLYMLTCLLGNRYERIQASIDKIMDLGDALAYSEFFNDVSKKALAILQSVGLSSNALTA